MTHEPRSRTSLNEAQADDARPLHEFVDRWRERQDTAIEWCVCGGYVRAPSRSAADVMWATQQHQIDPVHIAYDETHGIPLSTAQMQAKALDGELAAELIGGR